MPNVSEKPRQMGNGQVVTSFVDTVGITPVTFTYPKTQETLVIKNTSIHNISVTAGGSTQTIQRGKEYRWDGAITSFTIQAESGVQSFEAWSDEIGSTFDSPEGQYFQRNGGGSGASAYPTLSDLQSALPNGAAYPVWVTSDKAWYYWGDGTDPIDTTAPILTITPAATFANTKQVVMSTNEQADIYYTLDGSTPTIAKTKYATPITLADTTTVKAMARDLAGNESAVQTVIYTKDVQAPPDTEAPAPVSSLTAGTPTATTIPITIGASPSGDVVALEVAYSTDNFTSHTVIASASLNPASTTYTITGLTASTAYTVRVVAKDGAGNRSTAVTVQASTAAQSGTPAGTILVSDTFDRADSTTSLGTAETGQTWQKHPDSIYGIQGNQAYFVSKDGFKPGQRQPAFIPITSSDYTVEGTFSAIVADGFEALHLRYVDVENTVMVYVHAAKYKIYKVTAGVGVELKIGTKAPTNGDVLRVECRANGNIKLFVNDVLDVEETDITHLNATNKVGFGTHNTGSRFNNFKSVQL